MDELSSLPKGTNLRLLLQDCICNAHFFHQWESIQPYIQKAVRLVDLHDLSSTATAFTDGGYTAAIILSESHIVIHTWPEHHHLVLIEISVCDFKRSNRERTFALGERLIQLFQPQKILRETTDMIPRFSEAIHSGYGYYLAVDALQKIRRSAFQEITIADTPAFGRSLLLNGILQTSEKDACFYHEPLVHVPMLSHTCPRRVLLCGGGDGGAAYEVLKHPSVSSCTLVDIDAELIALAKTELIPIHHGALEDSRLDIQINHAADFLQESHNPYDVILLDTTDPHEPTDELLKPKFLTAMARNLSHDGWASLHLGAPLWNQAMLRDEAAEIRKIFGSVYPYLHYVPSYGTLILYILCSPSPQKLPTPEEVQQRLLQRHIVDLQILSPQTFPALFCLPPCLESLLQS